MTIDTIRLIIGQAPNQNENCCYRCRLLAAILALGYDLNGDDLPYPKPTIEVFRKEKGMDTVTQKLDAKLREWPPHVATEVKQRVTEIIELADQDALDVMRSRKIEQEVMDLIDDPKAW